MFLDHKASGFTHTAQTIAEATRGLPRLAGYCISAIQLQDHYKESWKRCVFPNHAPSTSPGHVLLPPSGSSLALSSSSVLSVQRWVWEKKMPGLLPPELVKPRVCFTCVMPLDNSPQMMPGEMQGRVNKQCIPKVPTICTQGPCETEVLPLYYR